MIKIMMVSFIALSGIVLFSCHPPVATEKTNEASTNDTAVSSASANIGAGSDSSITEKYWKLTELEGKAVVADSNFQKEPNITFRSQESRVTGNGGCNSISGTYELKPANRIAISKIISTRMACPQMEVESQFLKVLETVDNYNLNGDTLVLNKARMAPLARLVVVYMK